MPMSTSPTLAARSRSGHQGGMSTPALPLTIVAAMVVGALGTTVIAVIAHGAGVAHSFSPLQPGAYIGLILCGVLGVLGGGVRWQTSPYND